MPDDDKQDWTKQKDRFTKINNGTLLSILNEKENEKHSLLQLDDVVKEAVIDLGKKIAEGKPGEVISFRIPSVGTVMCSDQNPNIPMAFIVDEADGVDKSVFHVMEDIEKVILGEQTDTKYSGGTVTSSFPEGMFTAKKPNPISVEEILSLYDEMKRITTAQQQAEHDMRIWLRSYIKHLRDVKGIWISDFAKELGCDGYLLYAFVYMEARLNDTLINALKKYFQDQMRNGAITPVVESDTDKPTIVIDRKE